MNPQTLLMLTLPIFTAILGIASVQYVVRRYPAPVLRRVIVASLACGFLGSGFASVGLAAEPAFTSPKGFTITPPDGWSLMSKDAASEVNAAIKKQFPKVDARSMDNLAVMLLSGFDAGVTNLNVVVTPSRLPIGDSGAEQKVAAMLQDQYTKLGITVSKMNVTRKTFGTHPSIVADFESNIGGQPTRQWQVMMLSGKQTLIVTCSSRQATFEKYAPVFTKTMEAMTFPPDAGGEFPLWLRYGIIGGVVGGLVGLAQKLMASRKKRDGAV